MADGSSEDASAEDASAEALAACNDLVRSGSDELARVFDAHQACAVDDDCTVVPFDVSCIGGCGGLINVAGSAELEPARAAVEDAQCKQFAARGCPQGGKLYCPAFGRPLCEAGTCGLRRAAD